MNFYNDHYCLICNLPMKRYSVDEYIERTLNMLACIDKTLQTQIPWMFNDRAINSQKSILKLIEDDIELDGAISESGARITLYKIMKDKTASLGLNAGSNSKWASNNLNMEIPGKSAESVFFSIDISKEILTHIISIWHPTHAKIGRPSLFSAIDGGDYRLPPTAGWITYVTDDESSKCHNTKADYPIDVESVEPFGEGGSLIIANREPIEPNDLQEYDDETIQRMRKLTAYLFN